MATKRHLYLGEWIMFRGLNPQKLADAKIADKGQLSLLIHNKFTKSPRPETMAKLANFLNIKVEDLWQNPFDRIENRNVHVPFDLEGWLKDPTATLFGERPSIEVKEALHSVAKILVKQYKQDKSLDISQLLADPKATANGLPLSDRMKEFINTFIETEQKIKA